MIKTDPSSIWQEYKNDLEYKAKMGFTKTWPENIRFIEGKQWPAPTEKTKYMPRPVINQCDFIVENKKSNILSQSLKMIFSPQELPSDDEATLTELLQASEDYTDAAENTWHDIDQESLNEDAVNDALAIGTGVYHYYWDNSITGGQFTQYVGKLQGETIDPMDLILGNPQLKPSQLQKQPYIIIRARKDTDEVKERAKQNGENYELITADDQNKDEKYDSGKNDVTEANKTTTLTKYYKNDGKIYWTEVTESAVVQKPRPLAPETSEKSFKLYPVEITVFKKHKKCSFGRGVIDDIINNQKALNWGLGMMLLSVQQTAWPKLLVKTNALIQTITNEPGEIVTDNFNTPGIDGIKYMQPPNFSQMPLQLSDKLLDMTRQVTGTTEVNSGEVLGANMAASAIIALQNQAKKPNEAYQRQLFKSIKSIGRIWEEFFKCYYNMARPIQGKDQDGNEITKQFTGSQYANISFGLKVDVGPTSVFDESLQITILDKYAERQWVDKYQYTKYLPSNLVPQALKQDFEKEAEQLAQQQDLQAKINQALSQLSLEEQQELQNNPELMKQFVMAIQGGMGNGMSGMQR